MLYKAKEVDSDGFITEMVIWSLPHQSRERPHGLKYRLYYGDAMGSCIVRYDNEAGKGDHKHIGDSEEPYHFVSVEKLMADFLNDIQQLAGTGGIMKDQNIKVTIGDRMDMANEFIKDWHQAEVGSTSILALANQLHRNYRNVHQDVKELSQIGLMIKDEKTGKYSVPWATIVTEIPLTLHSTSAGDERRAGSL